MTSSKITKGLEDTNMDPKTRWGTAHFSQNSMLTLTAREQHPTYRLAPPSGQPA